MAMCQVPAVCGPVQQTVLVAPHASALALEQVFGALRRTVGQGGCKGTGFNAANGFGTNRHDANNLSGRVHAGRYEGAVDGRLEPQERRGSDNKTVLGVKQNSQGLRLASSDSKAPLIWVAGVRGWGRAGHPPTVVFPKCSAQMLPS